MGRKPTYDSAVCKLEICDWISEGKTLRDYCRQDGKPKYAVIYDWLREDDVFAESYARAREAGHDIIAESILTIVDEMPPPTEKGGTDAGFVSWQKNRAWTRLQLLAKWNPKKYGDQKRAIELSGPNNGPVQVQTTIIDVSSLDTEAALALADALDNASRHGQGYDDPYIDEEDQE
jgi:hypothetical protein